MTWQRAQVPARRTLGRSQRCAGEGSLASRCGWGLLCIVLAGCAAARDPALPDQALAQTRPVDPAMLSLEQLLPAPVLPPAATQPAGPAPLDAIELYARGRAAQLMRDPQRAVTLLEQAAACDPCSAEVQYALGQALLAVGATEAALRALERSLELDPDRLEARLLLGRQYLARQEVDKAIREFHLATATSHYRQHADSAAAVDLFLARALQQKGYDQASLEQYRRLAWRLDQHLSVRSHPELLPLLQQPELLQLQIGQLAEKLKRPEEALAAYRIAAARQPGSIECQRLLIRVLLSLRRTEEARAISETLLIRSGGSTGALELLREVLRQSGQEDRLIDVVRSIHEQHPAERSVVFALAGLLTEAGRTAEAESLLLELLAQDPGDFVVVSRVFEFHSDRANTLAAARLLTVTLARYPNSLPQIEPLLARLLRPSMKNRLRLSTLQKLAVPPEAEPARLFLTAAVAERHGRDPLARSCLRQAAEGSSPFAPACRSLLRNHLSREDWDEAQQLAAAEALIEHVRRRDRPELAAELRGLLLLHQQKHAEAVPALQEALRLGNDSPEARYAMASALMLLGQRDQAETMLWRLTVDCPLYDQPYIALFRHYIERQERRSVPLALRVLRTWLNANPFSIAARILQANIMLQGQRADLAEGALLELFREHPDDPQVLAELGRFYTRAGQTQRLIDILEKHIEREPASLLVLDALVTLYAEARRSEDALRLIDATCKAAGHDPEQLYFVSHLYERMGRRELTEKLLADVLRLDPDNAAASNDLGYMWADEGRNLAQAEALIRAAVRAEPDNSAYLDSLGWVLYKLGRFEEAAALLKQAVGASSKPDPVVLDHLGDALYRLDREQEAIALWRRSLERLGPARAERGEYSRLRERLERKLGQTDSDRRAAVAPVASSAGAGNEQR